MYSGRWMSGMEIQLSPCGKKLDTLLSSKLRSGNDVQDFIESDIELMTCPTEEFLDFFQRIIKKDKIELFNYLINKHLDYILSLSLYVDGLWHLLIDSNNREMLKLAWNNPVIRRKTIAFALKEEVSPVDIATVKMRYDIAKYLEGIGIKKASEYRRMDDEEIANDLQKSFEECVIL